MERKRAGSDPQQAFPSPLPPLQGREPWERLTVGGYCPTCSDLLRALRTRRTSARLLAKARPAGTVERDGREFELLSWQQLCVVYGFRARLLTSKQRSQRPHYGQARKRRGQGSARCDDGRGAASFARSPPGWPLAQWKLSPFWPGSLIGVRLRTRGRYVTRPCRRIGRLPLSEGPPPAETWQKRRPLAHRRSARIPGHDVSLLDRNGAVGTAACV